MFNFNHQPLIYRLYIYKIYLYLNQNIVIKKIYYFKNHSFQTIMFVYKTFPMFMSHLITTYKCVIILSFACIFVNVFLLNEKIENTLTIIMGDIKAH